MANRLDTSEGNSSDTYKSFTDALKRKAEVEEAVLQHQKDPRTKVRNASEDEIRKRARNILVSVGKLDEGVTADELTEEQFSQGINYLMQAERINIGNQLSGNLEGIVKGISKDENLADSVLRSEKGLNTALSYTEHRGVLGAYLEFQQTVDMEMRYRNGRLAPGDNAVIEESFRSGIKKKQKSVTKEGEKAEIERQKKEKYPEVDKALVRAGGNLAKFVFESQGESSLNAIKEDLIVDGIRERAKEARLKYTDMVEEQGVNYKDAVASAFKRLAIGNTNEINAAIEILQGSKVPRYSSKPVYEDGGIGQAQEELGSLE